MWGTLLGMAGSLIMGQQQKKQQQAAQQMQGSASAWEGMQTQEMPQELLNQLGQPTLDQQAPQSPWVGAQMGNQNSPWMGM